MSEIIQNAIQTAIPHPLEGKPGKDSQSVNLSVHEIAVDNIEIRENIRKEYTGISELASSIKQKGLLQPITVYPDGDNFIVKTGHRRFMAFKQLYQHDKDRFHSIPCVISTSENLAIVQMIENTQREDLSPADFCNALVTLREQGLSNLQIAEVIGKSVGHVNNLFSAVNEYLENPKIAERIHAGVSLQDIAETKGISDEQARLDLLDQHQNGEINREEMRQRKKELKASIEKPANGEQPTTLTVSDDGRVITLTFNDKTTAQVIRGRIEQLLAERQKTISKGCILIPGFSKPGLKECLARLARRPFGTFRNNEEESEELPLVAER